MKSEAPKVLHEVCGRPMLSYVIDAALSVSPARAWVAGDLQPAAVRRAAGGTASGRPRPGGSDGAAGGR
jgi:bifunctional N-acetylglucosamine-1-phosphate-uridyltransferase/glucosamine-1-phosphate-acetyltransferase GlmU-like protein